METNFTYIDNYVKNILNQETTGHDYFHAVRVMNNALEIAKEKEVNSDIVKASALTHDLIDRKVTDNIDESLKELKSKLKEANYRTEDILEIINIIQDISYSKGKIPNSLEGRIVQDADRLDALGAIGIARTFAFGGKNSRMIYNPNMDDNMDSISHFYDKLLKLKNLMNTKEAKIMAEMRSKYMNEFLDRFYLEWEGKDIDISNQ